MNELKVWLKTYAWIYQHLGLCILLAIMIITFCWCLNHHVDKLRGVLNQNGYNMTSHCTSVLPRSMPPKDHLRSWCTWDHVIRQVDQGVLTWYVAGVLGDHAIRQVDPLAVRCRGTLHRCWWPVWDTQTNSHCMWRHRKLSSNSTSSGLLTMPNDYFM